MTTTIIKPTEGKVVLEELKTEEKTAGGIYIPDTSKKDYTAYRVVAVGKPIILPQGTEFYPEYGEGDTVLAAKSMGSPIAVAGRNYTMMDAIYIAAVLE